MREERWHISRNGIPAICHARTGHCPLGKNVPHFLSEDNAQKYIDDKHEAEFIASYPDLEIRKKTNNFINDEINKEFLERIDYAETVNLNYGYNYKLTKHAKVDHSQRRKYLDTLGEGHPIIKIKIHETDDPENPIIIGIDDKGIATIYATNNKVIVTRFPIRINKVKALYEAIDKKMPTNIEKTIIALNNYYADFCKKSKNHKQKSN